MADRLTGFFLFLSGLFEPQENPGPRKEVKDSQGSKLLTFQTALRWLNSQSTVAFLSLDAVPFDPANLLNQDDLALAAWESTMQLATAGE